MHCKIHDAMDTKMGSNLLAVGFPVGRKIISTVIADASPDPPGPARLSSSISTTQIMPVPLSSLSITFSGDVASLWKAIAVQNEKLKHWIIIGS